MQGQIGSRKVKGGRNLVDIHRECTKEDAINVQADLQGRDIE